MAALWTGAICGAPMRFHRLKRERTDTFPVCHRPPHKGNHHLSWAAIQHAREHQREMKAARMSAAAGRTGS